MKQKWARRQGDPEATWEGKNGVKKVTIINTDRRGATELIRCPETDISVVDQEGKYHLAKAGELTLV